MSRCSECAGSVVWSDDAASNICTFCGTLTDPSQRILTSADDQVDSQYFNSSAPNVLKRFRGGSSWNLAGESKEIRNRNNAYSMHEFIKSLSRSLSVSGLSPRVCTLFDQAMRTNQFRWGTKAKLVAAACLSIALRESGHPDSLKDLAFLIEASDSGIKRTLSSVLAALSLTLTPTGPAQYLPILQSHLSSILQDSVESSGLAISLYSGLKAISLRTATETAQRFVDVLARYPPEIGFSQFSHPAVACAVFIFSLEAEKRSSLSHLVDISAYFAKQCRVAKSTVLQRYEALQDLVGNWIEEVEWLDSYEKPLGRAKLSKRSLCARGLKDVLNWKHSLWKKRMETERQLWTDGESEAERDSFQTFGKVDLQPSRKRIKVPSTISTATNFLLDPLDASVFAGKVNSDPGKLAADGGSISSYLLSSSCGSGACVMPSRLQRLSAARGGAGSDLISDDELLADGEWELMLRSPDEIQQLELQWRDEGILEKMEKADFAAAKKRISQRAKEERTRGRAEHPAAAAASDLGRGRPHSKRIDLEAFSKFMCGSDLGPEQAGGLDFSEFLGVEVFDEKDNQDLPDEDGYSELFDPLADGGEIMVDDWRPVSPK
ncbi:hypothetical protein D9757_001955 [Collybiopsis confluens]|uniref:Uncharacterized protein n=1 Tax=Collybiopsis confluens TaxID=2823264 RepID=A0A8H5MEU7_9AGAR|nr:hypothetical protein D9757_001955 [Collybiopsis confluens]